MVTNNSGNIPTGITGTVLQGAGIGVSTVFSTATFPSTATGTGTVLISDGTNWVASTPTYPNSVGAAGTQLRSNGSTGWVASTIVWGNALTANNLLYASSTNTQGQLTSANNAILATNGSGVPSITTASGNWLNTSRTAFLGNLNTTATNKTGNGTTYTLGTDALTEIFDQGSNFTTAGVFTAPVTGKYQLCASIFLIGCTINANTVVTIVTSNRSYAMANGHGATAQDNGCAISHLCDMDASDTATVTVLAVGEAGDTDDVSVGSKFSGYLAC